MIKLQLPLVGFSLAAVLAGGTAGAAELAWGTTTSAPAGTRAELFGVAAAAADDVWAVGGFNPGQPPTAVLIRPYAEHWDGTAWAATTVPLGQVFASQLVKLQAAAAVGPGDAWAVGHVDDIGSLAARTLAYRWDGSQWLRVATPNPAPPDQGDRLFGVVARGPDEAWAVGGSRYPAQSLVLRWDGAQWRVQATPDIGPLVAVTANDAKVWAVSGSRVMQTKDGSTWSVLPDPPLPEPPGSLQLAGVAAKGKRLWVAGTVARPVGEHVVFSPYAAYWQSPDWTLVYQLHTDATALTGVAASADAVWASTFEGGALKLTTAGGVPQVTPAAPDTLNGIAVDPAGHPWAVGTLYGDTLQPALYNAPGIGQGGIRVTTGFGGAVVTWIGPVNGSGTADVGGQFSVGGLPVGSYQIIASGDEGCHPGVAEAPVKAGKVSAVSAVVDCS